jgi:hypothetical protein
MNRWYGTGGTSNPDARAWQVSKSQPWYFLRVNATAKESLLNDKSEPAWTSAVGNAIASQTNHLLGRYEDGRFLFTPIDESNPTFEKLAKQVAKIYYQSNLELEITSAKHGALLPVPGTLDYYKYEGELYKQAVKEKGWWRAQGDIWFLPGGGFDTVVGGLGGFTGFPGLGPSKQVNPNVLRKAPKGATPPPKVNYPSPPGFDANWTWEPPSGERDLPWRWWDPYGGEWHWHRPDQWHPEGHWDYNPWSHAFDSWLNVLPRDGGGWYVGP